LFNEHKAYEANYERKLEAYQNAYLEVKHDSPFATLDNSFEIG
jgi:hypothetical protein